MNIGNVSGVGMNQYPYTNSRRKATGKGSFAADVQKTAKEKDTAEKSRSSAWAGDMVVSQPPSYFGFIYDHSLSSKSKDEMTMDEYKQWFMNEMSGMPVSGWYRSTCVSGALTITEECFERMKSDPEWEKTVLGMVRKMYSCTGIMGSRMIGYQVIGATPEQCHGEGVPVKDGSPLSLGNEKSWWEKRHERMEELIEEIAEEEIKRKAAYIPEDQTYEYRPRGFYEVEYPDIPYPEVVSYTENGDGTLTLTVNAVYPEENTSRAYTHKTVVRPLDDGGFQYVSNQIIFPEGGCELWWHSDRLTEDQWKEVYGGND